MAMDVNNEGCQMSQVWFNDNDNDLTRINDSFKTLTAKSAREVAVIEKEYDYCDTW